MIDGLKPYDSYTDSGLPWLGEIPAHWELRRNGRLFVQRNETGFPDLPILEVSLKTGVRVRDMENLARKQVMSDNEKYKRAKQGDIAYNMMRMWQGAVGVAPVEGLISPAYVVASPLAETDSQYYTQLFRTGVYKNEINKFSRGIVSDRNRLYWEDFKQMPSPFPPPEEQAAIVRFLNHVDRRIGRYIRIKRQLMALLHEQRLSLIQHTVGRGLDPEVELTESGLDWLGRIPSHWKIVPSRFLFGHRKEKVRNDDQVLTASQTHGIVTREQFMAVEKRRVMHVFKGGDLLKHVEPDDFVMSMRSFQGGLEWSRVSGAISSAYVVLIPRDDVHEPYFAHFLKSKAYISALRRTSDLVRDGQALRFANFREVPLPLVPINEQQEIAAFLDDGLSDNDSAVARTEREIELLREYRTRLIADIVTGKLDVCEAAAALPDEMESVEPDIEGMLDEDELDTEPEEVEA